MQKFIFIIIPICLQFMFCDLNEIKDVKIIEGIWVIHSVSSKDEVFYPKGKSPLVDYYVFNSDSTGTKKKLKPNFNKNYSSSLDEINFEIKRIDGLIYLNYISNSENWKERIKKLTKNELIISNNKFDYHYKRFKFN